MFERVAVLVAIPDILHDSITFRFGMAYPCAELSNEVALYYSKTEDFHLKLKIGEYC